MLKLFKQRSFHAFNQGISFGLLKVRRFNTKTLVWFTVPEQGFSMLLSWLIVKLFLAYRSKTTVV